MMESHPTLTELLRLGPDTWQRHCRRPFTDEKVRSWNSPLIPGVGLYFLAESLEHPLLMASFVAGYPLADVYAGLRIAGLDPAKAPGEPLRGVDLEGPGSEFGKPSESVWPAWPGVGWVSVTLRWAPSWVDRGRVIIVQGTPKDAGVELPPGVADLTMTVLG